MNLLETLVEEGLIDTSVEDELICSDGFHLNVETLSCVADEVESVEEDPLTVIIGRLEDYIDIFM